MPAGLTLGGRPPLVADKGRFSRSLQWPVGASPLCRLLHQARGYFPLSLVTNAKRSRTSSLICLVEFRILSIAWISSNVCVSRSFRKAALTKAEGTELMPSNETATSCPESISSRRRRNTTSPSS